ncbi:MAG: hypothetical protein ACK4Q5_07795 [Saprospiraceae bacterium]
MITNNLKHPLPLLEIMLAAVVLLFSSPVFAENPSAQSRAFFQKMNSTEGCTHSGITSHRKSEKKMLRQFIKSKTVKSADAPRKSWKRAAAFFSLFILTGLVDGAVLAFLVLFLIEIPLWLGLSIATVPIFTLIMAALSVPAGKVPDVAMN